MPVPRRRHGKGRRDRSRTHKKLESLNIVSCENPNCGKPKLPHRICPHCGIYRGRSYKTTITT